LTAVDPSEPLCIDASIHAIRDEAPGVRVFSLRPQGTTPFPVWAAGAHIDLHLANGMVRSYSLCGHPGDNSCYEIAVGLDPSGRGGSRFIVDHLGVGQTIAIGAPRNHFPLAQGAHDTVLVAGGIGITPIWAMIQALNASGRHWQLHYAVRSKVAAVFWPQLQAASAGGRGQLVMRAGDDPARQDFDLEAIVRSATPGSHFYCCGPQRMLERFYSATAGLQPEQVHCEHFKGVPGTSATRGFAVHLYRSGIRVQVAPGQTILDALQTAGISTSHSCKEGVCGTCETGVISGLPDHRDLVLSKQEKLANKTLMICCSGAISDTLVLDL
jgi:tetrachlorobenzoquinone reductase